MARAGRWRPTASPDAMRLRARMLRAIRAFFDERGYVEVQTPLLSADASADRHVEAFSCRAGSEERFLQTSPEFAMKRLLAAGMEAVYQITHAFRRGERGRRHNPEFLIVEWYRVGDTHWEQMEETERLVRAAAAAGGAGDAMGIGPEPFERVSYREAFQRWAGFDPFAAPAGGLAELAARAGARAPASLPADDTDGWLDLVLTQVVEPRLAAEGPTFLYDYPASQAALARIRPGSPPVAERFELYVKGLELCNGYHELTDAEELRERLRADRIPLERASGLLQAMDAGLPASAGVALGFDRLVMAALGAETIDEVIPFPFEDA